MNKLSEWWSKRSFSREDAIHIGFLQVKFPSK